jgi:putative solute-binding periplasmic protein of iron/siderophore ABC transporter
MKKISTLLCLALLLLCALSGCKSETASEDKAAQKTVTVTDAAGRSVTLKQPIQSYAISTFDLIDFIVPLKGEEAFAMLRGVGDSGGKKSYDKVYEPRFPQYKDQWRIISPHNAPFDVEAILTAKPDVLIVNSAMQGHIACPGHRAAPHGGGHRTAPGGRTGGYAPCGTGSLSSIGRRL